MFLFCSKESRGTIFDGVSSDFGFYFEETTFSDHFCGKWCDMVRPKINHADFRRRKELAASTETYGAGRFTALAEPARSSLLRLSSSTMTDANRAGKAAAGRLFSAYSD